MSLKVTIIENGPAIIDAGEDKFFEINSPIEPMSLSKLAICRCGKSANGVWCDGSHSKNKNNELGEIQSTLS